MAVPGTFTLPAGTSCNPRLPIARLCERAGVAPSDAWDTSDFFRIWEAAGAEFADPAAGLRFGVDAIASGYGIGSIVALHAPDFGSALAALARYKRLTCPELVEVEANGDEAIVRYRWLQADGPVPRLLIDTVMASLQEMARRGSGGRVAPVRLELARHASDEALLQGHFGCSILFGAAHDAMVFERAALDVPFVTADGGAFAHVIAGLERRLTAGEGFSGLLGDLRLAIARQLNEGGQPHVDAIARRLGLSPRTLQRRLDECRTSFQHQLAEVRRITATRLLSNTALDPVAIAMLLGFVEPNSFLRAFRAWERTTPLRWRARHAADQLEGAQA